MTSEVWAALIVAVSAVLVAWMQSRTHKAVKEVRTAAEQTVTNTEPTSNGFVEDIQGAVKSIEAHLANQDRRRDRTDLWTAQIIANFDDRLVRIEELCQSTEPDSPSQPPTAKRSPAGSRQPQQPSRPKRSTDSHGEK